MLRVCSLKSLTLLLLCSNLIVIYLLYTSLDRDCKADEPKQTQKLFSVVLNDFDAFDGQHISESVTALCQSTSEALSVYILTEKPIYPPITLPHTPNCHVYNHVPEANLSKPSHDNTVESAFDSQFAVFVLRDYTLLSISRDITTLDHDRVHVVVPPSHSTDCLSFRHEPLTWSLNLAYRRDTSTCDAFETAVAFIVPLNVLRRFNYPYLKPTNMSIYLQAHLLGVELNPITYSYKTVDFSPSSDQLEGQLRAYEEYHVKKLFRQLRIKQVTYPDGNKRLYGCTKQTQRCFDTVFDDVPEYLYQHKWTPPCCLGKPNAISEDDTNEVHFATRTFAGDSAARK